MGVLLPAKRRAIVIVLLPTLVHLQARQRPQTLPVAGFLGKPLTPVAVHEVRDAHWRTPQSPAHIPYFLFFGFRDSTGYAAVSKAALWALLFDAR